MFELLGDERKGNDTALDACAAAAPMSDAAPKKAARSTHAQPAPHPARRRGRSKVGS
jgi:hypothetical protein